MPSNRVHCALSKKRTGFNFEGLHKWIDKDEKGLGANHRIKRHAFNTKEAKTIENYWEDRLNKAGKGKGWGKKAVVEWLFHIAIDNLETAFKVAGKAYRGSNAYNFFRFGLSADARYIHFDFGRMSNEELKKGFENKD